MHFFDLGEDVIWGATAEMLHALLLRLLWRVREPAGPDLRVLSAACAPDEQMSRQGGEHDEHPDGPQPAR